MSKTPKRDKEMRERLSRVPAQNDGSQVRSKQASAPEVGVFFAHGDNLWIDSTPVDEAIEFGNLAWPTSAVCFGPSLGTLMLRVLGSAGA